MRNILHRTTLLLVAGVSGFSTALLFPPSHRLIRRCSVSLRAVNGNDEDDNLEDLYKAVAQQDPEWYREFVTNILDEDIPAAILRDDEMKAAPISNGEGAPVVDKERINGDISSEEQVPVPTESRAIAIEEEEEIEEEDPQKQLEEDKEEEKFPPIDDSIEIPNVEVDEEETNDNVLSEDDIDTMLEATVSEAEAEMELELLQQRDADSTEEKVEDSDLDVDASSKDVTDNDTEPSVVVYRDLYSKSLVQAPLAKLVELGYTDNDEISGLQPDVLALILEDSIPKPSHGIPPQWKIQSPSQRKLLENDIRIVTNSEATKILEQSAPRRNTARTTPVVDNDKRNPEITRPSSRRRRPQQETRRSRRPTGEEPSRRRQRQQQQQPDSRRRRGDPPPPIHPIWMDVDKFRNLLRTEAEMRVQILGPDWEASVKRESQWRLNLYKEWLWSLSDGVEEQEGMVVPSRFQGRRTPRKSSSSNDDSSRRRRIMNPRDSPKRRTPPPRSRGYDDGVKRERRRARRRQE